MAKPMKIRFRTEYYGHESLEAFHPEAGFADWHHVISGYWDEGPGHGGYVDYLLANTSKGVWVLRCTDRNAELDGVTQEDIDAGRLNDDQVQALWGMTLEEAQSQEETLVVAVCEDAPEDVTAKEMAELMYDTIEENNGKIVDDTTNCGLIDR